jgi:hypothetical protein
VSDPPCFGADDDGGGAEELDDAQPDRMTARIAAKMIGADRIILGLELVLGLTWMLLLWMLLLWIGVDGRARADLDAVSLLASPDNSVSFGDAAGRSPRRFRRAKEKTADPFAAA